MTSGAEIPLLEVDGQERFEHLEIKVNDKTLKF